MEYAEENNYISLFCYTELSGPGFPVSRIGKLELCCDVKGSKYFSKYVADRNPVMESYRLQIAMKRLTCCNILGSGFPSGIKVSFENIVSEILSDYTLI